MQKGDLVCFKKEIIDAEVDKRRPCEAVIVQGELPMEITSCSKEKVITKEFPHIPLNPHTLILSSKKGPII